MLNFFISVANVLMVLTSLFLICLVLIQRGKGGGLAGAFGGVGGSSAFGTKAGDVFTRVTIYVAIFWFLLAMLLVWSSNSQAPTSAFSLPGSSTSSKSDDPKSDAAADKDTADGDLAPPVIPTRPAPVDPPPSQPANPAKAAIEPTNPTPAPAKTP